MEPVNDAVGDVDLVSVLEGLPACDFVRVVVAVYDAEFDSVSV